MRVRVAVQIAIVLMPLVAAASAQDVPAANLAFGYSGMFIGKGYTFWMHGGSISFAMNLVERPGVVGLGLVGDFGAYHSDPGVNLNVETFLVGPRLSYRRWDRFSPFAQIVIGGLHASAVTTGFTNASDAFAYGAGSGVDVGVGSRGSLAIRPQLEWVGFRAKGATTGVTRVSLGIVYRILSGR